MEFSPKCANGKAMPSCIIYVLVDFSPTVKAAPHECVMRTSQPKA